MDFNFSDAAIVFQEVPNEISLCFSISGCTIGCTGCHSTQLWNKNHGTALSNHSFEQWLDKYRRLISCVCFLGGEWQPKALLEKLTIAKAQGLKTCLYSGADSVDDAISQQLDFLKLGKWQAKYGGLDNPKSNQRFFNVKTGEQLNHLFYQ